MFWSIFACRTAVKTNKQKKSSDWINAVTHVNTRWASITGLFHKAGLVKSLRLFSSEFPRFTKGGNSSQRQRGTSEEREVSYHSNSMSLTWSGANATTPPITATFNVLCSQVSPSIGIRDDCGGRAVSSCEGISSKETPATSQQLQSLQNYYSIRIELN